MKIIFDNLGAVREGDYANEMINQGSHNVNKIYFAIENEEAQNNYLNYIATASFTFSNQESVSDVVMSATRFSFNDVEYNGYLLSLGKTLTAISGETSITFRVKDNSGNTILTTQPIVKTITRTDGNNPVINITESQYESLLQAVNNKVSVESGEAKNLKVKGILTIEAENGQSVNVECYGQGELKVPTLYAENVNGNKVSGEQGTFGSITLDDISDSDISLKILNYNGTLYRNENAEGYQYLIKSEIEAKDAETLNSAKSYTDAEKTKVLSESKTYTDGVFANGQTYTNNEINKIKDGTYLVGKAEKDINGNRIDLTYQSKTLSVQIASYTTVEQALQGLKQEIEVLIGGTISQQDLDTLKEIADAVFKARNDITALQEAINDIVLSNVPVATQNTAGIVKIGSNINVTADGTISIDLSSYALKSELPTNISQLTNDSGYIKNESNAFNYNNLSNKPTIPTNTSQLNNDSGYLTQDDITEEVSQTVECDHEYEITGNTGDEHGLAVKDQQVVVEKIQGQTRRYSENLLNIPNKEEVWHGVTISIKDGVIKLNGTCNITADYYIYGEYRLNGSYTLTNNFSGTSSNQLYPSISVVNTESINHLVCRPNSPISKKVINDLVQFKLYFTSGLEMNNVIIKPMLVEGTYTESTMPAFQPYDNTLVNSKCNLISTNKNLFNQNNLTTLGKENYITDGEYIIGLKSTSDTRPFTFANSDYVVYLPKGRYYVRIDFETLSSVSTARFEVRTENKEYGGVTINNQKTVTHTFLLTQDDYVGLILKLYGSKCKITLVYSTTAPTEYIPYEQDIFNFNVELGEFDTFDNIANKITRQTSNVITLDGSLNTSSINLQSTNEYGINNFFLYRVPNVTAFYTVISSNLPIQNTTIPNTSTEGVFPAHGGYVYVRLKASDVPDVSTFKTWIQQNPIQIAYKLETPTTEEYVAPNGYQVWNGGLQQQVIEGKYLPYVITKKYSVSIGAQLDANRTIDKGLQEQIDDLKNNSSGGLKVKEIYFDETQIAKLLEITTTGGEITLNESISGDYDCVDIFAGGEKLSRLINIGGSYVSVGSSDSSIVGNTGRIYTLMELSINVDSNALRILYTPDFGKIRHYRHTIIASVEITELGNFVDIPFVYITRQTALINSSDRFSEIIEHVSRGCAYTDVRIISLTLNQTNMELYIYDEKTLSYITKVIEYSTMDFRDTVSEV